MEIFICPLCRAALVEAEGVMRCPAGHSYDVARSGYVNLHRPGIKSNAKSGDPEDMVTARRKFLARGHYDRWAQAAAAIAFRCFGRRPDVFIDAACGEGRHTLTMKDELRPAFTLGVDASKRAADIAQKALRRRDDSDTARFIAGNIFDMPIFSECADVVSVLFAPIPYAEARRVLRPGGLLMICSAGREHLVELRRAIYDEVRFKEAQNIIPEGFKAAARDNVTYSIALDGEALGELFCMTPFCRRALRCAPERLAASGCSDMTVSVDVAVFRKL